MYAVIGITLIVFTIASGFYLDRQQFNRKNIAGVQEFSSYGSLVKTRIIEGTIKAMSIASGLAGIGFIIVHFS
ncbi:hypothetical protein [Desulfovibrio cuneatus]|uniref:hypothetical protein n=1 Tax=Desulfovibrio cuneatus TaxID=159728 RepID=UPI00054D4B5D|nr:hypothetical protein [Desulfovibrio cuneatus]